MTPVQVENVSWSAHSTVLAALRRTVFIEEQAVPEEEELDDRDASCEHFLATNAEGKPLGCARLTTDGQIGRMAVLSETRGLGIGRQLLDAAINRARELGFTEVYLHAQTHALDFYRKAGFEGRGPLFLDAGIEHQEMTLRLPPQPTAFADEEGARSALDACLNAPKRRLDIFHPDLDPALFDRASCLDGISRFVRQGSSCRVRVLLYSTQRIVNRGHGLIELARRLDSRIAIRKVPEEYAIDERAFLSWDAEGYWLLPNADSLKGLVTYDDAVMARRLTERFDYLWERSRPDPELRVLRL